MQVHWDKDSSPVKQLSPADMVALCTRTCCDRYHLYVLVFFIKRFLLQRYVGWALLGVVVMINLINVHGLDWPGCCFVAAVGRSHYYDGVYQFRPCAAATQVSSAWRVCPLQSAIFVCLNPLTQATGWWRFDCRSIICSLSTLPKMHILPFSLQLKTSQSPNPPPHAAEPPPHFPFRKCHGYSKRFTF